jgi:hypothetical protein
LYEMEGYEMNKIQKIKAGHYEYRGYQIQKYPHNRWAVIVLVNDKEFMRIAQSIVGAALMIDRFIERQLVNN